jgi:threonine/homoserine/homoserine lactone efflux protein
MPFEQWFAFAAASAVLLVIPGPTVLLVISYALAHGRRAALAMVAGVALGDFTAMTCSLAGVGALLAASAELFTALRWLGAAYLIYLGIKLWRAPVTLGANGLPAAPEFRPKRMFLHAFAVTALNPKGIVFFVAFLPQFVNPEAELLPQFAIFVATFVTMAALNVLGFAFLASAARRAVRKPAVQRAVNRTGGTLLIGAGVLAAVWRKS